MPPVPLWVVLFGGGIVLVVLVFQILLGNRKIPGIKGPAWRKWHRNTSYVLLVLALIHALAALDFAFI
jgi:cytochrome b561